MKTANRIQRKAGKKAASIQAGNTPENESGKPQSAPAAIPLLINPALAAANMVEAMAAYRVRINEAGALALLLAARIRTGVKEHAEWSEFDRHSGFADGVRELALTALARLRAQADAYGIAHAGMVEALRGLSAPVPPAPGGATAEQWLQKHGYSFDSGDSFALENGKQTMLDLLDMMGYTFSERNGAAIGHSIADAIGEELSEAFSGVWKAAHKLREAALAVEWQRRGEHRAAA